MVRCRRQLQVQGVTPFSPSAVTLTRYPPGAREGRSLLPDRLLKVDEARSRLRVSRERLYRLIQAGDLASVKLGPKSRRIRESDLDSYIAGLPNDGKVAS
jgi:excisionase family DNA binding protein